MHQALKKRLKVALKKPKEKNVKHNIKLKFSKRVVKMARDGVIVLEKLPRRFQDKVIEKDSRLNELDIH